jgi:hypothetical protein
MLQRRDICTQDRQAVDYRGSLQFIYFSPLFIKTRIEVLYCTFNFRPYQDGFLDYKRDVFADFRSGEIIKSNNSICPEISEGDNAFLSSKGEEMKTNIVFLAVVATLLMVAYGQVS